MFCYFQINDTFYNHTSIRHRSPRSSRYFLWKFPEVVDVVKYAKYFKRFENRRKTCWLSSRWLRQKSLNKHYTFISFRFAIIFPSRITCRNTFPDVWIHLHPLSRFYQHSGISTRRSKNAYVKAGKVLLISSKSVIYSSMHSIRVAFGLFFLAIKIICFY